MPPFNFPAAPSAGDVYQPAGGPAYRFDGIVWLCGVPPGSGGTPPVNFAEQLKTTPVAAEAAALQHTLPVWLAGPVPFVTDAETVIVDENYRGHWIHCENAFGTLIQLPDTWPAGMAFGVRQTGTGPVTWYTPGGATLVLPFTKTGHTGISEQHEEVIFRVLANTDGHSAVWGVSGSTS